MPKKAAPVGLGILALHSNDAKTVFPQESDLSILQVNGITHSTDKGRGIARDEIRVLAKTDYKWRSSPCANHDARAIETQDGYAIGSPGLGQCKADGIDKAVFALGKIGVVIGD